MSSQQYIDEMQKVYEKILAFIDDETNDGAIFKDLNTTFEDLQINDNQYKLKSILHILSKIVDNHHRPPNFFTSIEQILNFFKDNIKKFFSDWEIFRIFKKNKRILLFLIDEKIITIDEYIFHEIIQPKYVELKYPHYFAPEIRPFINKKSYPINKRLIDQINKEIPENFFESRKIGENDGYICQLIRNDEIEEFIQYVNKNNISLNSIIKQSIFETNLFLLKNDEINLLQYTVFFGSIQIFNYLRLNKVNIESDLWSFVIHSKNSELINLLEENDFNKKDEDEVKSLFFESIECHHNDIANYFLNNYLSIEIKDSQDTIIESLKHHNFSFIKNNLINANLFPELCEYDYYILCDLLLKGEDINVNKLAVSIFFK